VLWLHLSSFLHVLIDGNDDVTMYLLVVNPTGKERDLAAFEAMLGVDFSQRVVKNPRGGVSSTFLSGNNSGSNGKSTQQGSNVAEVMKILGLQEQILG